jgi:hypothetical protein
MDLYHKQYDTRQNTPAYWHNKSHDLLVTARTLWEAMQGNKVLEVNCSASYRMLLGMSFELIFKAHCVGAGIAFAATHDLAALVRTANFTTSKKENDIFQLLSEYIIWDGRYPTPKSPAKLKLHWETQNTVLDDELDFENLLPLWRKFSDSFMAKYN